MELIVAVYDDWGIGRDGTQPVALTADRKFFRTTTKGSMVIVGRRTIEDFPGQQPLPGRVNVALTRQNMVLPGFTVAHSPEEAVELASLLLQDAPGAVRRSEACREQLLQGQSLAAALGNNGLLTSSACRLLTLGMRGGNGDSVMEEIAARMQQEAQQAIESAVAKVEPALILLTSGLVGVILLSVMIPMMNIMSAIG